MGFVLGFLPWILYWVLIGNVPLRLVSVLVLAVAVAVQVIGRLRHRPWRSLEVGSLAVFALLTIAAFVLNDDVLARWMQPLSNVGIFLVALGGLLVGRPFVREYAAASVDERTARTDGFARITRDMTVLWIGVFAGMAILSAIPPFVDGAATLRDSGDLLSILCYWVLPYLLLTIGGLVSGLFPPWFEKRSALVDQREAEETPQPAPQRAAPPDLTAPGLALDAPAVSRHDEPFPVMLRGLPAGADVQLMTQGDDLYGRTWRSTAAFTAPPSGVLDLRVTAPVSGDWSDPSDDAPITAMRFAEPEVTPEMFVPPARPWQVTIQARVGAGGAGSGVTVRRTVERVAGAPGAQRVPVVIAPAGTAGSTGTGGAVGLDGLLVLPAGRPPAGGWPAVACFGGSEGGFESQVGNAEMLAAHGFAALAASWISEADAATAIASVPLERFVAAIRLLADHPDVDARRIVAMGISRGAEGLLAATTAASDAPCRGLVLISPSSLSWQAIGGDGEIPDTPSWTHAGVPVPWRPVRSGELMGQLVRNAWRIGRDRAAHRPTLLRLRAAYAAGLAHGTVGELAAERVDAPLLLLTGSVDAVWPSGEMADAIVARRGAKPDRHVGYEGAGHLIRLGNLPTDAQWTGGIVLGGDRAAQAVAQRAAIAEVLRFLGSATTANR
ncbi:acyl-CoA thioesterase/bile acid-CoA:amino acid N-acyltransferase family protein [Microbacterium sp.]|uniref:acyl-CoA thioesterase/bile acid-CoA:amino acid N-acyltransferase family protein n=1 Tax=Microbacterium sp. TaxID=51671 RepID=UPI0039E41156